MCKSELKAEGVSLRSHANLAFAKPSWQIQDSQDVASPQRSTCSAERNRDSDSTRTISPLFNNVPGSGDFISEDILPGQAADAGQRPFSFWCSHGGAGAMKKPPNEAALLRRYRPPHLRVQ